MQGFGDATIVVFGGAGFIGSNFIRKVLAEHPNARVVCLDALTYAGSRENLAGLSPKRLTFIKGDIADRAVVSRVFKKHRPSYVINFAAETHVDRSIHEGAEAFVRTNALGTSILLGEARKLSGLKKFVQVSTDEVYGALPLDSKKKFTENSPLAPTSPYAASKAAGDLIARSFFATYRLPVVITRCSNNYGPYQHPEKLIPYSVMRLGQGKGVTLYGDGLNVRDWIHVDDHNDALVLALLSGKPGEIYNIGANDEVSNLDLAKRLVKSFARGDEAISFAKDRPGHDRRYAIDSSKARRELGWKPRHTFKRSFAPTIAWFQGHEGWMKRMQKRAGAINTHIV